jgi:hypothetical protein
LLPHPAAQLGIGCINHKVDGVIVPHAHVYTGAGVTHGRPHLAKDETTICYPVDAWLERVESLLKLRV